MIGLIIALSVFCILLVVTLISQDNRNIKLSVENGLLKGRMETLQEKIMSPSEKESLTIDKIVVALQTLGYEIERGEESVRFKASGEPYLIEVNRLPLFFVSRTFIVNLNEWDIELLRKAAHQLSDEMIMVKAVLFENQNGWNIQFFVAAMDRNVDSFKSNITAYIDIVGNGVRQLAEIYQKSEKEQKERKMPVNEYLDMVQSENSVLS